jgi:hypothetical protein
MIFNQLTDFGLHICECSTDGDVIEPKVRELPSSIPFQAPRHLVMRAVFSRLWIPSKRNTRDQRRGSYCGPAAVVLAAMLLAPYFFSSMPSTPAQTATTVLEGRFDVIKPV